MAPLRIGPHAIDPPLLLAPMAGVTDRVMRGLCRRLGAGLAVSEMITSHTRLWTSNKTRARLEHTGEESPRSVQILGNDPRQMAEAARLNVRRGAQIVDINMGCPAKKVCSKAAGSALMRDEALVARILAAVVQAVDVPVTLKIRTGWDRDHRNGVHIARLAEAHGIQALAVHGRSRACGYGGEAEYDTLRDIKAAVSIPVIANGDIISPQKAKAVLDYTGADAVMIGRAAQGNPWLCGEIRHYLETGGCLPAPDLDARRDVVMEHVSGLHALYGPEAGARIARKHIAWYIRGLPGAEVLRQRINAAEYGAEQRRLLDSFFAQRDREDLAA